MNKIIILGELIKNLGLGLFVNALYGLSSNTIEIYNIIDLIIGIILIVCGIILENIE